MVHDYFFQVDSGFCELFLANIQSWVESGNPEIYGQLVRSVDDLGALQFTARASEEECPCALGPQTVRCELTSEHTMSDCIMMCALQV